MDAKEIIEGNKLIANFMAGYSTKSNHNFYHESWNELMPVVEKIENSGHETMVQISANYCMIDNIEGLRIEKESDSKLDSVFLAVVEFIQWYNQNKEL